MYVPINETHILNAKNMRKRETYLKFKLKIDFGLKLQLKFQKLNLNF